MQTVARQYLPPSQAGVVLGVAERTLTEWRRTGRGPRYTRLGGPSGRVRYEIGALHRWMAEREHTHTAAESAGRR
jgi:hypothetical protein